MLNVNLFKILDMSWDFIGNIVYNCNEVLGLFNIVGDVGIFWGGIVGGVGNNVQIFWVGQVVDVFYVYEYIFNDDGIFVFDEDDFMMYVD